MDSIDFLKQYTNNGLYECDDPECDDCSFGRNIELVIKEIQRLRHQVDILNQKRIHSIN